MWRTEPNGDLWTVLLDLKLVVHEGDSFSRFLLLGRSHVRGEGDEVLLESGCADDIHAAKARAVEKAIKRSRNLTQPTPPTPASSARA